MTDFSLKNCCISLILYKLTTFVVKSTLHTYFRNFILSHAKVEYLERWTTWRIESPSFPRYVSHQCAGLIRKFSFSRRESMLYSGCPFIRLCYSQIISLSLRITFDVTEFNLVRIYTGSFKTIGTTLLGESSVLDNF